MSPSKRMRAWGAAISSAHLCLGLVGWLLMGVAPWFFAGCALLTLGIFWLAAPLMRPRPDDDDDRGPGGRRPDEPEPPWWPEFEREFRDYADGHLTAR